MTTSNRWTLIAATLGFGVVQLDVSVVNVAIKPIGSDLGGSVASLQWIVDAYTVGLAALILSAGTLGDRLGAKRMYIAGFALFTLASAGCGLAPDVSVLLTARAAQGVGAAVLIPCSLSLLTHGYPDARERARAVGLWAAGASIALSAGPLVGGVLTASLGWRWIFFINAPLGALGILLTARFAAETTRSRSRAIDPPGQVLAVVTLVTLAAAAVGGGQRGFVDSLVLCGFAVSAGAGSAFVLVESRRRTPMLPLGLFRTRTFTVTTAMGLLVNIAFYGLIFVLSLYFQSTRGMSVLQTGLAFAPTTVAVGFGNVLGGRLSGTDARRAMVAGAVIVAASLSALLLIGSNTPYLALVGQLVMLGFGLGVVVPAMTAALLGSVDASRSGLAAGTLNTARQAGSVIGVAVFGSLSAGHLVSGLRISLLVSIALSLTVAALAACVTDDQQVVGRAT